MVSIIHVDSDVPSNDAFELAVSVPTVHLTRLVIHGPLDTPHISFLIDCRTSARCISQRGRGGRSALPTPDGCPHSHGRRAIEMGTNRPAGASEDRAVRAAVTGSGSCAVHSRFPPRHVEPRHPALDWPGLRTPKTSTHFAATRGFGTYMQCCTRVREGRNSLRRPSLLLPPRHCAVPPDSRLREQARASAQGRRREAHSLVAAVRAVSARHGTKSSLGRTSDTCPPRCAGCSPCPPFDPATWLGRRISRGAMGLVAAVSIRGDVQMGYGWHTQGGEAERWMRTLLRLSARLPIILFSLSSYISSLRAGYRHRVCSLASHTQLPRRGGGAASSGVACATRPSQSGLRLVPLHTDWHDLIECARSRRWSRWRVSHLASWCSCDRADAEEQSSGGACTALAFPVESQRWAIAAHLAIISTRPAGDDTCSSLRGTRLGIFDSDSEGEECS